MRVETLRLTLNPVELFGEETPRCHITDGMDIMMYHAPVACLVVPVCLLTQNPPIRL